MLAARVLSQYASNLEPVKLLPGQVMILINTTTNITRYHLVMHFPGECITLKSGKPGCEFRGISSPQVLY